VDQAGSLAKVVPTKLEKATLARREGLRFNLLFARYFAGYWPYITLNIVYLRIWTDISKIISFSVSVYY
jgi:hypothetical protein